MGRSDNAAPSSVAAPTKYPLATRLVLAAAFSGAAALILMVALYVGRLVARAGVPAADAVRDFGRERLLVFDITLIVVFSAACAGAALLATRQALRPLAGISVACGIGASATLPLIYALVLLSRVVPDACTTGSESFTVRCVRRDVALEMAELALAVGAVVAVCLIAALVRLDARPSRVPGFLAAVLGAMVAFGTAGLLPIASVEGAADRFVHRDQYVQGAVTNNATGQSVYAIVFAYAAMATPQCCNHVARTFTDGSGRYEMRLPPGRYRVLFAPWHFDAAYAGEWWDGAESFEAAADIVVPGDVGNVNARLRSRRTISGRVTSGASGSPIPRMDVLAYIYGPSTGLAAYVARARTNADGRYVLRVPDGAYRIDFEATGYVRSVWRNAVFPADPTELRVAGADIMDVDQVVPPPRSR